MWLWPFSRDDDPIVSLLIRIRRGDNTCDEDRVRCRRSELERLRDELFLDLDVREIWVYEQVYHQRRSYTNDQPEWIAGLLGTQAIAGAGIKGF